jgi:hypothetical protein
VVEAAMKKVEEMKEVVVSTVEKVADEVAGAVKAIIEGGSERKAWEILNQVETNLDKSDRKRYIDHQ